MKDAFKKSIVCKILFGIDVLVTLYTLIILIPVSYGESVRPMGWAFLIILFAIISLCIGVITAVVEALRGKYITTILSLLLSITPLPLAMLMFGIFIITKGLRVLP
jgi:hypothetical protein